MTAHHPDSAAPVATEAPIPLQRMDVIAWWERERSRTLAECRTTAERITHTALATIDTVPDRDFVIKGTAMLKDVHQQIEAELAEANQALATSLQVELAEAVQRIEGTDDLGKPLQDAAALAAGGVGVAAAGGLALSATSLATTSSTILFVIPVVTFSWPIFLLVGAAAAMLATVSSGATLMKIGAWRKSRFRTQVQTRIQAAVLAEDGSAASSWSHFRQEIDRARDVLLAALT